MSKNQRYSQNGKKIIPYTGNSAGTLFQPEYRSRKSRTTQEQQTAKLLLFGGSAVLIFLVFLFFLFYSRSKLIPYPIIENLAPESTIFEESSLSLYKLPETLTDYETRLDRDLSMLLPDYECSESDITIFYYPNWDEKADLAQLTFTHKKRSAFLSVSTTGSPAPQELLTKGTKITIGSVDVFFGYTQSPETFYAAWEKDNIYYCLSQKKVSHSSFSKLVESILA